MAGTTSPTRKWLMLQPRPARVRVHVEGEATPRELVALAGGQSWAKLADTVDAFKPRLVEALDAAGAVVRACSAEQLADAADEEPDAASSPRYAEDDPTVALAGDSQIETFARLLAQAHQTSAQQAQAFIQIAFDKLVEMSNVQSQRLDRMQTLVDSMHRRFMNQAAAAGGGDAEEPANDQGALLMQMLSQFMAGQNAAKANGAANGHGKGDG